MKLQGQESIERETELRDQIFRLKAAIKEIVADASTCTSACSRLVDERLIEKAAELVGVKFQ